MNIARFFIIFVIVFVAVYVILYLLATVSIALSNIVGAILALGALIFFIITVVRRR